MAAKIKPMTKSELRHYVQAYRPIFGDWTAMRGEGFVRISGPVNPREVTAPTVDKLKAFLNSLKRSVIRKQVRARFPSLKG